MRPIHHLHNYINSIHFRHRIAHELLFNAIMLEQRPNN